MWNLSPYQFTCLLPRASWLFIPSFSVHFFWLEHHKREFIKFKYSKICNALIRCTEQLPTSMLDLKSAFVFFCILFVAHQILLASLFLLHLKMNLMTHRFSASLNTDVQKGRGHSFISDTVCTQIIILKLIQVRWGQTKRQSILIIRLMITRNRCLQTKRSTPTVDKAGKTLTWWLILTKAGVFWYRGVP